MFRDIIDFIGYQFRSVLRSRLFPLSMLFLVMFGVLTAHLFQLQIIEGEDAQATYTQTTKKIVSLPSTRGNIYDVNGEVLAQNKLVYVVTVTDTGDYSNGYKKNLMLLDLIHILQKHDENFVQEIPIMIDHKGNFKYTVEGNTLLRFLRDMYGLKSIDDFDEKKSSDITAQETFEYLKNRYGIGKYSKKENDTYEVSDEDALLCMNIRYGMALNSYQKYVPTSVSSGISTRTMQDILEHSTSLLGVEVTEDYVREYYHPEEFAHIIGYTGKASTDDIAELNAAGGSYVSGDVIGKTGIESSFETMLQGKKGERIMYVDSEGHITSVESETEATTGNDIHLTIDSDLQVGIYHLIEQQLAGIILDKLEEGEVVIYPTMKASERRIGIRHVYFQFINNNILDMNHFSARDAKTNEKYIYSLFSEEKQSSLSQMETQLTTAYPAAYKDVPEDIQIYMTYVYSSLKSAGVLQTSIIDTQDETYQKYRTDEEISLQEFLRYAIRKSWIDTTKLELSSKYTSSEDTYQALVKKILELLGDDISFNKKIYEQMIDGGRITGNTLCLALYEQGVLEDDPDAIEKLTNGNTSVAYQFVRQKIRNLELTPAMLALDPCSAAVTVIDTMTGDVRAMVSYPGYDTNRISDSGYYYKLSQDQSYPLYSAATQTRTAPGSTFKLVTTIAGMSEGILNFDKYLLCDGLFDKQGMNLKCTGTHGNLNVVSAIEHSCNDFFSEVGYRLSLNDNEDYSESIGVSMIEKYADMVGLGMKSGVEVTEMEPKVSDAQPIPSAIGQGMHAYSNVQLARYANTLAASGNVYRLTLLDTVIDMEGRTVKERLPELDNMMNINSSIWDAVHQGMYRVTHYEHRSDFDPSLDMAGKTGTAEENKMRPNHATFVGYAPYETPKYSLAVTIPYGFSSTYSCRLANSAMSLVFNKFTVEDVMQRGAKTDSGVVLND